MADPKVLDTSTLDDLREGGGEDLVRRVLEAFAGTCAPSLAELRAALARGDAPAVAFTAHRLKSGCLAVGAVRAGGTCLALETEARAGRLDEAPARADALAAQLDEALRELAQAAGTEARR